jgi:hypothetical protein
LELYENNLKTKHTISQAGGIVEHSSNSHKKKTKNSSKISIQPTKHILQKSNFISRLNNSIKSYIVQNNQAFAR